MPTVKPTILVVGEWPFSASDCASVAGDVGYELIKTPDRLGAASALAQKKPSVLLLGPSWPKEPQGIGGLLEVLRSDWHLHDIPILAAVDDDDDVAIREAYRRGCDDVLLARKDDLRE